MINNLFVFHGVDHKVGTTMVAQSVAEMITSQNKNLKVLFISLNGRESTEYVREAPITIDAIKMHIDNKMISCPDFLRSSKYFDNFHILAGISNEIEERYYYPETARYLLETVTPEFDVVITDSGNEIDNGLAIGALTISKNIYLILTQQESILRRFERLKGIYEELGISFNTFVINKYYDQDPYSIEYIADRIQIEKGCILRVESTGYSRQAEIDYKTLIEYKNDKYTRDIINISNNILNKSGFSEIKRQRKKKWKSFI